MEGAEKCDDKLNEAKETGNRNELTVDGVIKRPSLRKDSLFLTRKRLSKTKSEMDYEAVDSIELKNQVNFNRKEDPNDDLDAIDSITIRNMLNLVIW